MGIDSRDAIWNEAHELRYYASYAEQIEYALLARWSWLDGVTKVAVAATSTGSALASLALWRDPVSDFEKKLIALREKYKSEARKFSHDILLTTRLAYKTLQSFNSAAPPVSLPSIPERNHHEIR